MDALVFGKDIDDISLIDALTLDNTTTDLKPSAFVLPADLNEDMVAVATFVEAKIMQEIDNINHIPDQSFPLTESDDI